MKTITQYNGWSSAGDKCHTSSMDMAKVLLASSTIHFSDGHTLHYPAGTSRLLDVVWVDETQDKGDTVIPLPQLNTEDRQHNVARFVGAVFIIQGDDLRLRSRAYPGHKPEDFPEYVKDGICKYPRGEMRLSIFDAREEKLILENLHKRLRELREAHHV
jgi:hypothetical protein